MPVRLLQNVNVTDAFARDSATKNVAQGFSQGFCNRTNRLWDENLEPYR